MIGTYTATGGQTIPRPELPHAHEVAAMFRALPAGYRAAVWMSGGGATQGQIGEALGICRPAVALRLRQVRRWVRLCAPIRARLRRSVDTPSDALDAALLDAVLWRHIPVAVLARRSGWRQGALARRWDRLRTGLGIPKVVGSARWVVP
jgi:hypothetical protein